MQPPRIPKYRHQKSRNLAVTRIYGKDIYLGKYTGWYSVSDEAYYDEDEIVEEGGVKNLKYRVLKLNG